MTECSPPLETEDRRFISADERASRTLVENAVQIIVAYVGRHNVMPNELAGVIKSVHQALLEATAGSGAKSTQTASQPPRPAVSIRASVTPDVIFCLEDGKPFRSLRRHLKTRFNLTPDEYRKKWGLPPDYPMVAPNYSNQRSRLARNSGLGRKKPVES